MSRDGEDASPMPPDDPPTEPAALPTVSAVIPAYNAADTIERALDSVYAQTYPNIIEVIVVDDGSTDATAQVIRDKFPDVILIQQENGGNAAARNAGVDVAIGEYIAFLDADDEWLPDKIAYQVSFLRMHHGCAVLLTRAYVHSDRARSFLFGLGAQDGARFLTYGDWFSRTAFRRFLPCCSSWVVRRDAFLALGGFDTRLRCAVDWQMLLRACGQGHGVAGLLRPLFRHHAQANSVSRGHESEARVSDTVLSIMRRQDPSSGAEWARGLLSEDEYARRLQAAFLGGAVRHARCGHKARARELVREAASVQAPWSFGTATSLTLGRIHPSALMWWALLKGASRGRWHALRAGRTPKSIDGRVEPRAEAREE